MDGRKKREEHVGENKTRKRNEVTHCKRKEGQGKRNQSVQRRNSDAIDDSTSVNAWPWPR